jgi:hypothetical protein
MFFRTILSALMCLAVMMLTSAAMLFVTPHGAAAQTVCPSNSVRTNQVGRYTYNNAERNLGGSATCNGNVGIPADGIRVFSSWNDCRTGAFKLARESGGGVAPTSLSCPNCSSNGAAFVRLAPGTSSSLTAFFRFPDGAEARYTATISRSAVDANGRYVCSISNASLAGGAFGGDIDPPIVTLGPLTRQGNGASTTYTSDITLSEAAGNGTAFEASDLTLANATATLTGSGTAFTATLTPQGNGTVSLAVAAAAFQDAGGNANTATAIQSTLHNGDEPTVSLGALTAVGDGTYRSEITLSELPGNGTAFEPSDLTLRNASATFNGSGTSFIATLTPQSNGRVGLAVAAGVFQNAAGNDNIAAPEISLLHSSAGPIVEILGLPEHFTGAQSMTVSIRFSKAVSGFELSDIALKNAKALSLSGGGLSYSATIQASGNGDVMIQIPAGVAQDSFGNPNQSSPIATSANRTVGETQKQIASFMISRANNLASNQPELTCFIADDCQGRFEALSTRGRLDFDIAINKNMPVWASLVGARNNDGQAKDSYYLASFGAHRHLSRHALIGAMVQLDYQARSLGSQSIMGRGWLIGPYFVGKLPNQPLLFELRGLWGKSQNKITPFGSYTDRFETRRALVQGKVSGELKFPELTLRPFLSGTYTSDHQNAYQDSLGNLIPEQSTALRQVAAGLDFRKPIFLGDQMWALNGGLSLLHSDTRTTGGAQKAPASFEGTRGRLDLGLSRNLDQGIFSVSGFLDGIGRKGFEAVGIDLSLTLSF